MLLICINKFQYFSIYFQGKAKEITWIVSINQDFHIIKKLKGKRLFDMDIISFEQININIDKKIVIIKSYKSLKIS